MVKNVYLKIFTFILKISVILLGYTKISCIFVKEITNKTNQNENNNYQFSKVQYNFRIKQFFK